MSELSDRELNVLVAEKVMGIEPIYDDPHFQPANRMEDAMEVLDQFPYWDARKRKTGGYFCRVFDSVKVYGTASRNKRGTKYDFCRAICKAALRARGVEVE